MILPYQSYVYAAHSGEALGYAACIFAENKDPHKRVSKV